MWQPSSKPGMVGGCSCPCTQPNLPKRIIGPLTLVLVSFNLCSHYVPSSIWYLALFCRIFSDQYWNIYYDHETEKMFSLSFFCIKKMFLWYKLLSAVDRRPMPVPQVLIITSRDEVHAKTMDLIGKIVKHCPNNTISICLLSSICFVYHFPWPLSAILVSNGIRYMEKQFLAYCYSHRIYVCLQINTWFLIFLLHENLKCKFMVP
jgi:hypothetical protein